MSMYQVFRSRWGQTLIWGSALLVTACGAAPKTSGTAAPPSATIAANSPMPPAAIKTKPTNPPQPKAGSKSSPSTPAPDPKAPPPEAYSRALDKAESAQNIASTARSRDDWSLVASQWQQAVQFMQAVPASHAYYKRAQSKLGGYQRFLANAKARSAQTSNLGDNTVDTRIGADQSVNLRGALPLPWLGNPAPDRCFKP